MSLRTRKFIVLAALTVLFAGCAQHSAKSPASSGAPSATVSTVHAPLERDAQARLFRPVPGKAVMYVLRNDDWFWVGSRKLTLDGKDMGALSRDTYMRWEVAPGKHEIISYTEPPSIIALDTQPGGIYYVWQDIYATVFNPHYRLRLVDYTTARLSLEHCVMLERNPPL